MVTELYHHHASLLNQQSFMSCSNARAYLQFQTQCRGKLKQTRVHLRIQGMVDGFLGRMECYAAIVGVLMLLNSRLQCGTSSANMLAAVFQTSCTMAGVARLITHR